jgi:Putative homoserine kinase type II (protein kinase fold)
MMQNDVIKAFEANYDFGTVGSIKRLTGGLNNFSFLAVAENGSGPKNYYIRVYSPKKEEQEIIYEHDLMKHLRRKGCTVNGLFFPCRQGKTYFRTTVAGNVHYMAVQEWLTGEDRYFWAESKTTKNGAVNAMKTLAQLNCLANDYVPQEGCKCKDPIIQEHLKHYAHDFDFWTHELAKDHFKQTISRYMLGQLDYVKRMIASTEKMFENPADLPTTHIHTDAHMGNFKFTGADDTVTAVFDFDWAKMDVRLYDVGMAAVAMNTSWFYDKMGEVNLENVAESLRAYNQIMLDDGCVIGQLTETEAKWFPDMMIACNIYIMRDLLRQSYENRDLSDFEYLYFMVHQVESMKWIEARRQQIVDLVANSIVKTAAV